MSLKAITALDGRYETAVAPLADYFSEYALIKYRVLVEVRWLRALAESDALPEVRPLTVDEAAYLERLARTFDEEGGARVKEIERTTNHDVKAVEYYIKEHLAQTSLADVREWVHFACTSEDINNLAYALMLKEGIENVWLPRAEELTNAVEFLAKEYGAMPMLARTHGQPASPTTVGKEMAVFGHRWERVLKQVRRQEYLGKMNGAVGNFNAHTAAYPNVPWPEISRRFVDNLGLTYNPMTTQIEPHDYVAEVFHAIVRFNNITLDFDRDMWTYISLGYFKQKPVAGEVGSSTMPHKVNPIDFENGEANLGVSTALLEHLAGKLAVSRLQRDLSDSSALRNIGSAIGHSYLAVVATLRGLRKVSVNEKALAADLEHAWEVLGEAVQTVMRKHGHDAPYEKLKELTRGAKVGEKEMRAFIATLDLPFADKQRLLRLTPATYTGIASALARSRPEV